MWFIVKIADRSQHKRPLGPQYISCVPSSRLQTRWLSGTQRIGSQAAVHGTVCPLQRRIVAKISIIAIFHTCSTIKTKINTIIIVLIINIIQQQQQLQLSENE